MRFFEIISELFRNLNQQRLRSFLTIFGIMWGTATLILLLAFGFGFRDQTVLNMRGMGDQIAIMFPGQTTKAFEGYGIGRPIRFTEDDVSMMQNRIPEIKVVTPEYIQGMQLTNGENKRNSNVGGVYTEYSDMRNIFPQPGGRWLNQADIEQQRRVIFLGNQLADNLFGDEDPVGKQVFVRQTPFTVVGVMQEKTQNNSYSQRDHDRAFIPGTTFSAMTGSKYLNNIIYTPGNPAQAEFVQDRVYEVFGSKYRFDATDLNAIGLWDTNEFWEFIDILFYSINAFLGLIGFFTLAVGGIGVANIMFVVVQERMKEIGIRRSVGAKRMTIMGQFFLETFLIVGVGAGSGFLLGWGLVQATQNLPIQDFVGTPFFAPEVGMIAFVVLGITGFAAGLLPAWRAANLSIIDCLR